MKNEIDKTVERIKQRGDDHKLYCPTCKAGRNCMEHLMIRENDLQEQVTQLKADLATAKQGLEHYADICSTCLSPRDTHDENGQVDMLDEIGHMICGKPEYPAQQTLDKIGKE